DIAGLWCKRLWLMSPKCRRRRTHGTSGKSKIVGPAAALTAPDPVDAGALPLANVRVPGPGRVAGGRPAPPAVGRDAQQPWPQYPDLLRPSGRRAVRVPAGVAALPGNPLGQRLSHRRSGPRHLAPARPAVADGDHAARPNRI